MARLNRDPSDDEASGVPARNVSTADVLLVASAYAGRDDWGVENIYLRTLTAQLDLLAAGLNAKDIAAHASHVGPDDCPIARARRALAD